MPYYERQPYVQALYQILVELMEGAILVPRFQRPGTESTWTPEQRQELLDSLYRGFPIGTILVWAAKSSLPSLTQVGGFAVPSTVAEGVNRFLLDGHQRLSTLVQIFGEGLFPDLKAKTAVRAEGGLNESWFFDLNQQQGGGKERFVWSKDANKDASDIDPKWLPLHIVMNRSALNRWIREHDLSEAEIKQADSLRDRMREYTLPVAVLQADTLQEAAESFKRINSSGKAMDDFNMVAALAFRENFDLQQLFESKRDQILSPVGWAEIRDTDILRVCAGILNGDAVNLKIENLSAQLAEQDAIVERAFRAIAAAARVLQSAGVWSPAILPYSMQMILAAIVLDELAVKDQAQLSATQEKQFQQWLLLTTYTEMFSVGNKSNVFTSAKRALIEMLSGKNGNQIQRDMQSNIRQLKRQVTPIKNFEPRAARTRACALAMAHVQDRGSNTGLAHIALGQGYSALKPLLNWGKGLAWANFVIVADSAQFQQIRDKLNKSKPDMDLALNDEGSRALMAGLGLTWRAGATIEQLLEERKKLIVDHEIKLVRSLGLEWVGGSS